MATNHEVGGSSPLRLATFRSVDHRENSLWWMMLEDQELQLNRPRGWSWRLEKNNLHRVSMGYTTLRADSESAPHKRSSARCAGFGPC